MGRLAENVDDLTYRRDGDGGVIRTASGLEMALTINAEEGVWIGQPSISMRQIINLGMRTQGNPNDWKYPQAFREDNPLPDQKGYGFQIHEVVNPLPFEMWNAGLRLQEHLSAEMRTADDLGSGDPEIAMNWYELAEADAFLSPIPTSQGVRLVGDVNPYTFRWHSSGWQNSPVAEPLAESHWYPEIYTLHGGVNFRHLTAKHRWVGGNIGDMGSFERPSLYPALDNVVNWHQAQHVPVADNAAVAGWPCASGRGRHWVQPTSGKRPTVRRDAPGGARYVHFNGVQCLRTTSLAALQVIPQPLTIFLVMRQQTGGSAQQVWLGPNTTGAALVYRGDATDQVNVWAGAAGDLTYHHAGGWPSDWMIWSAVLNGASTSVWENRTEVASGDAGATGLSGLVLGADNAETLFSRIDVREVIVAASATGDTARADMVDALNARHDVF